MHVAVTYLVLFTVHEPWVHIPVGRTVILTDIFLVTLSPSALILKNKIKIDHGSFLPRLTIPFSLTISNYEGYIVLAVDSALKVTKLHNLKHDLTEITTKVSAFTDIRSLGKHINQLIKLQW
jgi:hypothetical protein